MVHFPEADQQPPPHPHAFYHHPTVHNGKAGALIPLIPMVLAHHKLLPHLLMQSPQVTFSRIRYHEALQRWKWQEKVS